MNVITSVYYTEYTVSTYSAPSLNLLGDIVQVSFYWNGNTFMHGKFIVSSMRSV